MPYSALAVSQFRRLMICGLALLVGTGGMAALGDVREGSVAFRVWVFLGLFAFQFAAYLFALAAVQRAGGPSAPFSREPKASASSRALTPQPAGGPPTAVSNPKSEIRNQKSAMYLVLSVALASRLTLLFLAPAGGTNLSDDVHRYVWDGMVQHHGLNPYLEAPAEAPAAIRNTPIGRAATHLRLPAVYPPLTELTFALLFFLTHTAWGFRLVFVLFDLATIAVLYRMSQVPSDQCQVHNDCRHLTLDTRHLTLLVYAWHPLVISEFAGNGHFDSLGIFLMVLAVYLLERGRGWHAYLALGASVAAKYIAAPLVLFFWPRTKKRNALALVLVLLVLFWQYLPGGYTGLAQDIQSAIRNPQSAIRAARLFTGLRIFSAEYFSNEGLYRLGLLLTGETMSHDPATRLLMAGLILILMGVLYVRRVSLSTAGLFTIGACIVLNRVVHPWYACWIVPWIALGYARREVSSVKCQVPSAADRSRFSLATRHLPLGTSAWLLFTGLIPTAYTVLIRYVPTMHDPEPCWAVPWWSMVLQYGTLVGVLAAGAFRHWRRRAGAAASS